MGIQGVSVLLMTLWMVLLSSGHKHNGIIKVGLKKIKTKNTPVNLKNLTAVEDRIILKNPDNGYYYGEIGVGTPSQNFRVLFDTESSDMWVSNTNWPTDRNKYASEKSSTYIEKGDPVTLDYDGTQLKGYLSKDDVTIATIVVKEQEFIEATHEVESTILESAPFDGVLGLGFRQNSLKGSHTIWENMLAQDLVRQKVFSIWLKYYNTEDEEHGVIMFGGFDKSHFTGEHTYVSVTQQVYWEFQMGPIHFGEEQIEDCAEGCAVMVDTGYAVVKGPQYVIDSINQAIGMRDDLSVDCEKIPSLPTISFTIGGRAFPIFPKDYIQMSTNEAECTTLFKSNIYHGESDDDDYQIDENLWILGEVFLRRYHTIYDFGEKRIGFAEAVQENN